MPQFSDSHIGNVSEESELRIMSQRNLRSVSVQPKSGSLLKAAAAQLLYDDEASIFRIFLAMVCVGLFPLLSQTSESARISSRT